MKKSDLKTGMVVETRNNEHYLVMLNPDCEDRDLIHFKGGFMPLCDYDDDLTIRDGDTEWDIVKVYQLCESICLIINNAATAMCGSKVLWERPAETVEMTIAEIEEKLGVKNLKIVKGDE